MASTSPHGESLDAVWQSISADSARIFELSSTKSTHSQMAISTTVPSSIPPVTISLSVVFPAPDSITSDFLSLGLRFDVAEDLSSDYLQAIHDVKDAYEKQCNQTTKACAHIVSRSSGTLLPDLLSRLRDSFVSRYMRLQQSWARETLLMAQQWLLDRNLNTQTHSSLTDPFTKFAKLYEQSCIQARPQIVTVPTRACWKVPSNMRSPLAVKDQTSLVFDGRHISPDLVLPPPKRLENSALVVLSPHEFSESRPQSSTCVVDMSGRCLDALQQISLDVPVATAGASEKIDHSSCIDTMPSHSTLPLFGSSTNTSFQVNVGTSPVQAPSTSPLSAAPATITKGPRRKLAALPKRFIKEAASPLSASTPTPPPSELQFKPSEPKLPSSTLHTKSIFATDVSHSSSSVFSPLNSLAPAPSSFLSFALAKDETSAAATFTSHTTNGQTASPPPTAHPLFGRPSMAPLPSRHTLGYSRASDLSDGSSVPSVALASSPISRKSPLTSVATEESESSSTVLDHLSTPSSSQQSTSPPPLLPAWSPSSPPPSKGRRRKVAPLPSRHLLKEPTFPTFNEKYSTEPSFAPTSPPSRAPSLEPAFSDASTSPEPDTLPTPPSSPPGFSFSSPVILSPESHVPEPLFFAFAKSRSEHDNSGFHFGSPPPTSKPLQKGRLDFGFPSIDQTLQGSSASFSFSFDRPS